MKKITSSSSRIKESVQPGMKKKKKISKYLSDLKLSASQKEAVWLLESDKKIIWVVGHAIDDRFKIKPTSTNILKLVLKTGDL